MLRLIITLLLLLQPVLFYAQSDYEIAGARKVKMNHMAFPRDVKTEPLAWTGLNQDCTEELEYGNWFELKLKGNRVQFTVHSGGRFGNISDPGMYLGEVVTKRGTRSLTQVKCVQHQGNEGEFQLQATELNPESAYFLLVSSNQEGAFYAISTTSSFVPDAEPTDDSNPEITASFRKIFGRVYQKGGDGVAGVPISLLDENQQTVSTTQSDAEGAFSFQELPEDQVFLTRIESEDTDLMVDMFLLDSKGEIINRSSRIEGKIYAFGAHDDVFPQLNLLTAKQWKSKEVKKGKVAVLGKVVDRATYLLGQEGVKVGLYGTGKVLLQTSETDAQGNFRFNDLDELDYDVKLESGEDDYAEVVMIDDMLVPYSYTNSNMKDAAGFFTFQALPQDIIRLKRMEAKDTSPSLMPDFSHIDDGHPIVLRNILFSSGASDLLESSYRDLNVLALELKEKPSIKIEVSGHTDDSGNSQTNQMLSEARAKAVVNYLVSKGVSASRLSYKGYGSERPVTSNETEEGRKRNRRVEFVMVD